MFSSIFSYRLLTLCLFVATAIGHAVGTLYSLYFYWWWYDILMHLLGGFAVALFAGYIFFLRPDNFLRKLQNTFPTILFSVLAVGILWEIFELTVSAYYNLNWFEPVDTLADLLNDLLGALAGFALFRNFSKSWQLKSTLSANEQVVEAKILI